MRPPSFVFRLCAATALAGLMLAPVVGPGALAQPVPPIAAPGQGPANPAQNPPERVGWLQQISGGVSFHTSDANQWSPAAANYPVASGDALWTEQNASARVAISGSMIGMAGGTELDVATLDANGLQSTLPQGELYLDLRGLAQNETWSVQTPRGMVTFAGAGQYGVTAGDTQDPTTVTVLAGSAQISGPGFSLQVAAGQTASATGAQTFQGSVGTARMDAFLVAMQQAGQAPPPPALASATAAPAVVAEMPGGDNLSAYGTWTDTTDYGQVWYPRVAAGWVPYREGSWSYVSPWGWTWIDSHPWGFAPFHYGRWAQIGGRWGWTPGAVAATEPPVYAPALVAFFGVGIGAAIETGTVGWFPLGPHEPYHPWYHASNTYVQAVNRRDVTNVSVINRSVVINQFVNRGAVTAVTAAAMAESRPVGQAAVRMDPHLLASARPVVGTPPIRPTEATAGVTPNLAREMHLPAAQRGAPAAARVAPGPAIHAMPLAHGVAARAPLPPLPPHAAGAAPGGVARPAGVITPALRRPGESGLPPIAHPAPGAEVQQRAAPHEATPAGIARPGEARPGEARPGEAPAAAEQRPPAGTPQPQRVQERGPEHPAAVPHPGEHPAVQAGAPHAAPPPAHAGPEGQHAVPAQEHIAPHTPAPEAHPAPPVHATEQHAAPPVHAAAPEVHAAPPHAPAPEVHAAPPHAPAPEVHASPPHAPAPEVHAPPPQRAPEPAHAAPPPQAHPAPAPHPAPAEHEKKPGEP